MGIVELILRKRAGKRLTRHELRQVVRGAVDGSVPDYQIAAWLMAVCWQGMSDGETADLTLEMAASGATLDWSDVPGVVVDKHSTGGVGDKATLVVAPIVAACGVPVAKLTGRGLGHTGGTVDKLESIPGLRLALAGDEFKRLLREHGLAIASQSAELAPADGVLYALRDATGTVESIPLIASSIMSKKLAGGAHAILLDVKVGSGAFMKDRASAERLAGLMVAIGERAGRRMRAVLSNMEQPLGRAVGNALELAEAIETLRGEGPADLRALCRHEAAALLVLAGRCSSELDAAAAVDRAIRGGAALAKLAEAVAAQGGDATCVRDPERLPRAPVVRQLASPRRGYIARLDALTVGRCVAGLGASRRTKADTVRHDVGIVLRHALGEFVEQGEPLAEIHATTERQAENAQRLLRRSAFAFSDEPVLRPPVLLAP